MKVEDPDVVQQTIVTPSDLDPSDADWLRRRIRESGALLRGHFELLSGAHTEYFLRFQRLGWDAEDTARIARLMLERRPPGSSISHVLSAETASAFLGKALADQLDAVFHRAKVDRLRRPLPELRDEGMLGDVAIAHDIASSGRSLSTLVEFVRQRGAQVRALYIFARHEWEPAEFESSLEREGLVRLEWPKYTADACPICQRSGSPPALPAIELN